MGLLKGALILSAGICIGYSAYHCIYIDEKFGETGKEIAGNVSETVTEGAELVLEEIIKLPGRVKYFYEVTKEY